MFGGSERLDPSAPRRGIGSFERVGEKIRERGVGDPEARYKIAQAYAVLGDKTSALPVLRTSVESRFFSYPYIQRTGDARDSFDFCVAKFPGRCPARPDAWGGGRGRSPQVPSEAITQANAEGANCQR